MSADQGNAGAPYRYGLCLFSGSGVEQNKPEAARFLKMSADNGNAGAEVEVSVSLVMELDKILASHPCITVIRYTKIPLDFQILSQSAVIDQESPIFNSLS